MTLIAYLYLLRFPMLFLVAFLALPWVALRTNARSLLAGLFDIDSGGRMFFVCVAAYTTAWSIMETWWLVMAYAPQRFGVPPFPVAFPFKWMNVALFSLAAIWVVIGVFYESSYLGDAPFWRFFAWAVLGVGFAFALLLVSSWDAPAFQNSRLAQAISQWLASRPELGAGYIARHAGGATLLPGHARAVLLSFLSLVLYVALGVFGRPRLGRSPTVPTLAYVLLLLMVLTWALAGLAFFFDRYRFPALLPVFLLIALNALLPQSDNYYRVVKGGGGDRLSPATVIRAGGGTSVIVVAANGGGIQAAAWTARVLTGLELKCRKEFGQEFCEFGKSIRFISSVSGGSVGVMHFVNVYGPRGLPAADELASVAERARTSSLDEVAWGLVYPDLWRAVIPRFPFKYWDRAAALETAWMRNAPELQARLAGWREGVAKGWRPATVFNATIADSGERLLLATSDLKPRVFGRKNFYELYPDADISAVAAARLSATFPYVTPAARADLSGPQFHVVDGGYYDNYGMSTLVEWLDEALSADDNPVRRVLVLEIRGAPLDHAAIRNNQRGWFYQSFAPLATMLHVRTTGQFSHNEVEFDLLRRVPFPKNVRIESAVFEFREPRESPSSRAGPPLSWHLTEEQKQDIETAWKNELETGEGWKTLKAFLSDGSS